MNLQDENIELSPVDIIIGKKLRLWRLARGFTQGQLGEKVGISYTQIQKYENGSSRVLASRLYDLAKILSVDISDFFVDVPASLHGNDETFDYGEDDIEGKEILELIRDYRKIKSKKSRGIVCLLTKSFS